ncbi:hypothetical protein [Thiocapsa bogorovii]|uniref:hypothetical protein n=1 Tax=Thiocapsa bogorovii TaxID=521689 RepID=UPI001E5CF0E4|nr:hypothetical protein [Thiocapsa bogorovii]UHD17156.1 hypothetical protein LT988_03625 [Thiocapsa bogorovii]
MNLRPAILILTLTTAGLLQIGCAGDPGSRAYDPQPGSFAIGDRPQMEFPGATRAEVQALAMGSARSRAWVIAESTDGRLVVQRPLDSSSARALGAQAAPGSLVEVTSYFLEDRNGVKVALDSALVSTTPAGQPTRIDTTETFRPSLEDSLRSLQTSWSRNRARIARAAPPVSDPSTQETDAADSDSLGASGAELADSGSSPPQAGRGADASPAAPAAAATSDRAPGAAASAWSAPAQTPQAAPAASVVAATAPVPEPRRPAGRPAPIVDTRPALTRAPPGAATQPMSLPEPLSAPLPEPIVETIPESENMMALSPSSEDVSWTYYAEQYARLRGCNVEPTGSILIDSRSDGEIHKVPCVDADSVLVQCQNGECRGLL